MKKFFKGILASVLVLSLVFSFGACQKKDEPTQETTQATQETTQETQAPAKASFVGVWKLTSASASGVSINDPASMGLDMSFEFKEDGTAALTMSGETQNAKWEEKDGNIEINDGTQTVPGKLEDGKLVVTMKADDMEMTLTFEKQ